MILITRNNYEAYLLDYVEEALSPELIAELMLFFENNPDLKEDLDEFEIHELIPPTNIVIDKTELKKEKSIITSENCEDYMIAEVEGENSPEISSELHLFLNENTDQLQEFEKYKKTKLITPVVYFENKQVLKKKEEEIISIINCEDVMIAEIEGQNSQKVSRALHLFLNANPVQQKDFKAYQKAKLIAPVVIFENKKALKKKAGIIIPMYWWYSSAAAAVAFVFLLNGFGGEEQVYYPIANRIENISPVNGEGANVLSDIIVIEDEQFTVKEKKFKGVINLNDKKKQRKGIKNIEPLNIEEPDKTDEQFAEIPDNKVDHLDDSTAIDNGLPIEINNVNEDLYADVKIIYEEEELIENNTPATSTQKKITKFEMASIIAKDRLDKGLTRGKGLLMAFNAITSRKSKGKRNN